MRKSSGRTITRRGSPAPSALGAAAATARPRAGRDQAAGLRASEPARTPIGRPRGSKICRRPPCPPRGAVRRCAAARLDRAQQTRGGSRGGLGRVENVLARVRAACCPAPSSRSSALRLASGSASAARPALRPRRRRQARRAGGERSAAASATSSSSTFVRAASAAERPRGPQREQAARAARRRRVRAATPTSASIDRSASRSTSRQPCARGLADRSARSACVDARARRRRRDRHRRRSRSSRIGGRRFVVVAPSSSATKPNRAGDGRAKPSRSSATSPVSSAAASRAAAPAAMRSAIASTSTPPSASREDARFRRPAGRPRASRRCRARRAAGRRRSRPGTRRIGAAGASASRSC